MALAVDMLLAAAGGLSEEAVLVSGDGNLPEAARELDLSVRGAQFQDAIVWELASAATEMGLLDGLDWKEPRREYVEAHSQ